MIDYRLLFRGAPTPLLVLNPKLQIVEANDAYLAVTGTEREEIVGRPVFEVFPDNPDDPQARGVEAVGASLQRVLQERVPDTMPVQKYDVPKRDGGFATRYWAPVHVPMVNAVGEVEFILQRVDDVTAFMLSRSVDGEPGGLTEELGRSIGQAEAEIFTRRRLQQRHKILQVLADGLDSAVIGCDGLGRPVLYNDAARAITGDRLDGARAEQWPQRLHLFDPAGHPLPSADNPLVGALHEQHACDAEVVMRPPGETARTFRMHVSPIRGSEDVGAVVALHDVTALRRATRLKECELRIAKVISSAKPTDDVLVRVVEVIGSTIGWAATEFWLVDRIGQVMRRVAYWAAPNYGPLPRPTDPLPPGDALPARAWLSNELVWATDLDPERHPLRAGLAIPMPSGADVLGVLVCYSDTTEVPDDTRTAILTGIGAQLGGFLQLRRVGSLSAELDRTRDEYVALVGHELRTPLTSIQAYTELLLEEPDLAHDHREMIRVMHRNLGVLSFIVGKLLDVAGLRAGFLEVRRAAMDLAPVVLAAVDAARGNAEQGVTIEVNVPATAPIHGDPERLRQVVDELLNNALIWAPEHTTIGVTLNADAHAAVLSVSNTGEPISSDERDRLFDLFFRGGAARHGGVPGSGLGLTLAQAVVEQHGGAIAVSSPEEAVTVFSVNLPAGSEAPAGRIGSGAARAEGHPRER